MDFLKDKCYNSVLSRKDAPKLKDNTGRIIAKGTHIFSYAWDYAAGHFPHMARLIKSADLEISGFPSNKSDAPESRSYLLSIQRQLFGDQHNVVDINAVTDKSVLHTKDIFKFFIDENIISKHLVLAAGTVFIRAFE